MAGGSSSQCKLQSDPTNIEDLISKLPDAILVEILSLLTIEEAGRSSVLSHRWRNLWKFTTRLNFHVPEEERWRGGYPGSDGEALRTKYVTLVNYVLRLHEGCSLDEFTVTYRLDASYKDHIDDWIKFVLLKRTKRIEIDLHPPRFGSEFYSLSQECLDFFKSDSYFMCLTSLTLGAVNVDGELIEYLLSKCPHLETLSISYSKKLLRLKVAGPSLPLRCLKISAQCLESIELCAPNLVTLSYHGNPISFILGRNPLLSELYLGGGYPKHAATLCLPLFSSYLSQLQTLTLWINFENKLELPEVSGLRSLKHLKCLIGGTDDRSLIGLIKLIMAAPCLLKLTLELVVQLPLREGMPIGDPPSIQPHDCLKEVKIAGYVGSRHQLELVRYL